MHDRYTYLGREFLTWLWFATERDNGRVEVEGQGAVGVEFCDRLTLGSDGEDAETSVVKAMAPLETEEARTSLRSGKKVDQAFLKLMVGEREYQLTLLAANYTFCNVKLPSTLGSDDSQVARERLFLLNELESIVDGLYLTFMLLRRDPEAWATVRDEMGAWVRQAKVPPSADA